jgi:hypothetical protein
VKNPFIKLTPQQLSQLQRIGAANRRRLTATLSRPSGWTPQRTDS